MHVKKNLDCFIPIRNFILLEKKLSILTTPLVKFVTMLIKGTKTICLCNKISIKPSCKYLLEPLIHDDRTTISLPIG